MKTNDDEIETVLDTTSDEALLDALLQHTLTVHTDKGEFNITNRHDIVHYLILD